MKIISKKKEKDCCKISLIFGLGSEILELLFEENYYIKLVLLNLLKHKMIIIICNMMLIICIYRKCNIYYLLR